MLLIDLFKLIKDEFCSLWSVKDRGDTLEIITPYSTTSNKFVSIFLTYKKKEFIVSDGGWLSSDNYESSLEFDDDIFGKIFTYYESHFDIKTVNAKGVDYYFKKTDNISLVPAMVYDVANFISSIANSAQIQYQDLREKEEKKRFNKQANNFLSSIITKRRTEKLFFLKPISDDLKSVKFSAIAQYKSKLTLINYVTGSTLEYFTGSVAKANITFEVAENSKYGNNIKTKIALIDNKALGYNKAKLYNYLERLDNTTKSHNIFWHEKDKLKSFL